MTEGAIDDQLLDHQPTYKLARHTMSVVMTGAVPSTGSCIMA